MPKNLELDFHPDLSNNLCMSTITPKSIGSNPNLGEALLEESLARVMSGRQDPERMAKALEAARREREKMRQDLGGVLDVCVELIRETRDQ